MKIELSREAFFEVCEALHMRFFTSEMDSKEIDETARTIIEILNSHIESQGVEIGLP